MHKPGLVSLEYSKNWLISNEANQYLAFWLSSMVTVNY